MKMSEFSTSKVDIFYKLLSTVDNIFCFSDNVNAKNSTYFDGCWVGFIHFIVFYLYMYMYMGGYWFSYVLVMVMLSGVFMIFSYMSGLLPNENFEIYEVVFLFGFLLMFMYKYKWFGINLDYMSLNLWVNYVGILSLFLEFFLFGIMVLVIWMSNKSVGAVRVN